MHHPHLPYPQISIVVDFVESARAILKIPNCRVLSTLISFINKNSTKPSLQFWFLAGFLTVVFLTGGASRIDVQSLIILRPVSILACALALLTLRIEHIAKYKSLLIGFSLILLLTVAHLIPLPHSMWSVLPGRQSLVEIEALAQIKDSWRPLTITPMNGWHSLVSLITPFAVILFAIQLDGKDLRRLLPLLMGMILVSGLFGLLQVIGNPNGPLYFYRITNNGSAVGLFSNRNHAATFLNCAFPMLAAWALAKNGARSEKHVRQIFAVAAGILLIPLILVTGSRSGLLLAAVSLAGSMAIYYFYQHKLEPSGASRLKSLAVPAIVGMIILTLVVIAQYFSRAEAIQRLLNMGTEDQLRTEAWQISLGMFWKYFPFGSGAGSFVEAFQIDEPRNFLSTTYLNRAHNDWIETIVTFGLPGLVMLAGGIFMWFVAALKLWRERHTFADAKIYGQVGLLIIALIAAASIGDYPLRTPIMMCLFSIMSVWISYAVTSAKKVAAQS